MSAQVISPELQQWLQAQLAARVEKDQVLQAMQQIGWAPLVARRAYNEALEAFQRNQAGAAPAMPSPDLRQKPSVVRVNGHDTTVLLDMKHPRVVVLGNFLTDAECDAMRAQAQSRLTRSETVTLNIDASEVNDARTSDGMFFERGENELCTRIEARIASLLHWPVERGEGLQVLRYRPGAEYLPHFDYFDPAHASTPSILKRGGQRVGTLLMYLNTPTRGGGTVFPDAGFEVAPIKGNAVFFSYDSPNPDTLSLHGGSPVLEGEKWVATKWLRQGTFE
ncbi:MAG: 2OG-Fe(II) oxygenase [Burkholderiaceae bacterium]|nr:2OG-Fe(II) oxygenase [Roseateles sp.]MBV8468855.1 2OG-Fe(II) oxygenase [Burkholderiaceae bacterium]